jgi:hypothetical protein
MKTTKCLTLIVGIIMLTNFVSAETINNYKHLFQLKKIGKPSLKFSNRVIGLNLLKSSGSGEKCYDENTRIINAGIGFGGGNYYHLALGGSYSYIISPAFSLTYEQPLKKKVGPGYIGVGAYAGFQTASYTNNYIGYNSYNYYYEDRWNYIIAGARGAYHWDVLNSGKAEVYGGVIIGLRIQTYTYTTNDPNNNNNRLNEGSVYPAFSIFAGARWYFVKKVALFGELGYGISYATAGVSFKV